MNLFKHKCDPKKMTMVKVMGERHTHFLDHSIQQIQSEHLCKCGEHWYECQDYRLPDYGIAGPWGEPRWHKLPERLWTKVAA